MTEVGSGGVQITALVAKRGFDRYVRRLTSDMQERLTQKLDDLLANPRPPGLRFEKLQGYKNPAIYTIHLTGNYKVSMEIIGNIAYLRKVADHDTIDRAP